MAEAKAGGQRRTNSSKGARRRAGPSESRSRAGLSAGRPKDSGPPERPDVEIGAGVKADSLRFREKPRTEVDLHGEVAEPGRRADIEMTSGSERENLPDEVEPGVTYRDISVRWRATGRVKDDEHDERQDTPERRKR